MGMRELLGALVIGGALVLGGCESTSSTKASEPAMTELTQEEMMERWMAYSTPGPEHERLMERVGTWTATVTSWENPSAPPMVAKGVSTTTSTYGGRYIVDRFSSEFMGMPYEGMGVYGYNNHDKVHHSTWFDNFGTGMVVSKGHWDDDEGAYHYYGQGTDPMNGTDGRSHMILRMVDANTMVMTMFQINADDSETKMMQIDFARAN